MVIGHCLQLSWESVFWVHKILHASTIPTQVLEVLLFMKYEFVLLCLVIKALLLG